MEEKKPKGIPPVAASEKGPAQRRIPYSLGTGKCGVWEAVFSKVEGGLSPHEWGTDRSGCESRMVAFPLGIAVSRESGCLKVQPKVGGMLHLRLNIPERPIAKKYREGKLKRTLKREFKST